MGRRLESATRSNGSKVTYTYNADGLLTSKKVGLYKLDYYWNGDKLTAQTDNGNTWYFRYDGDTPIGFKFNGTEYYYVTNLQGDIIAILDSNGTCVAEYEYDAWGNFTITKDTNTVAYINPIRYRGYYYDSDTDLYYLQSRYYDANTGRFINADEPTLIGANGGVVSNNLFAYCDNNPVNKTDRNGSFALAIGAVNWWNPIGWVIGAIAAVVLIYTCVEIGIRAGKAISQISKNKRTKIPSKLKSGSKVKTPTSHSSEFTKNKGAPIHIKKLDGSLENLKTGIMEEIIGMLRLKMLRPEIITILVQTVIF